MLVCVEEVILFVADKVEVTKAGEAQEDIKVVDHLGLEVTEVKVTVTEQEVANLELEVTEGRIEVINFLFPLLHLNLFQI